MIDKLIPWRLVADIGTSECIEYSSAYDYNNTNLIIKSLYDRTDLIFFNKLKFYLLNLYNQNVGTFTETHQCDDGSVKTTYTKVEPISIARFDENITEEKLLMFYMKIRMYEEDKYFSEGSKIKLMKDTTAMYRLQGLERALGLFE